MAKVSEVAEDGFLLPQKETSARGNLEARHHSILARTLPRPQRLLFVVIQSTVGYDDVEAATGSSQLEYGGKKSRTLRRTSGVNLILRVAINANTPRVRRVPGTT